MCHSPLCSLDAQPQFCAPLTVAVPFSTARSDKQKQRLAELEVEVAALSQADKGTRGERAALVQRNTALQAALDMSPPEQRFMSLAVLCSPCSCLSSTLTLDVIRCGMGSVGSAVLPRPSA